MKNYLLIILLSISALTFSQENNYVESNYKSYFELPRETIYTHLNKTTFITGENIWFKAYAHDRHNDLQSKATTNINVGVYDNKGKLIKNQLWLANNSGASGNILIDSTFTTGDYYIKASTNWMKNFEESDAFIQKIRIIANDFNEYKQETLKNDYDFQFLPEGGHLILNVNNNLGFKIIDRNGNGVIITGTIYDESKNEITNFKSNTFGIGKCLFTPIEGKTYTAEIILKNGSIITKPINDIKNKGISISIDNLNPKKVFVSINTNPNTFKTIKSKPYKLVIHKDEQLKTISFSFETSNTVAFSIPKDDIFKGINILTVFDENNKPLLERLIFNNNVTFTKTNFAIQKLKSENDTIQFSFYDINNKTSSNTQNLTDLSISILPQTTLGYDVDHTIISANLLKPYVKGHVEKPSYYFKDITQKKLYDLDLLLLTQGWSRYKWHSVFNNTPKAIFKFENGVTLVGKVQSEKKIETLRLQAPKLIGFEWTDVPVKSDNTFEVKKYFPLKNEIIRLSYLDKKGKLTKPNLYVNCQLSSFNDFIANEDLISNNYILKETPLSKKPNSEPFFYDNEVKLDEVYLKGHTKKKADDIVGKIFNVTFKNNYTHITEDEVNTYRTILDFIDAHGYNVNSSSQFGGVQITRNFVNSINSSQSPIIYYDDAPIFDFDFLQGMLTSNIEGIQIDKAGLGAGMNGANGVIRIYSRRTPLRGFKKTEKSFAHTSLANNGFTEPQQFYAPKYKSYNSNLFKYYGTIGWFPNIFLENNKSQILKVPDTNTEAINFYIEGYDSKGNFVSEIKTVTLTEKNN